MTPAIVSAIIVVTVTVAIVIGRQLSEESLQVSIIEWSSGQWCSAPRQLGTVVDCNGDDDNGDYGNGNGDCGCGNTDKGEAQGKCKATALAMMTMVVKAKATRWQS